ncbi:MAG: hypothetical protein LEGION0403_FIIPPAGN_01317 [Legionella sp.]|uniref:hypothetical protein n=1 Tax=Legionella sp. TaxID=459 RepID=UPI003D0B5350
MTTPKIIAGFALPGLSYQLALKTPPTSIHERAIVPFDASFTQQIGDLATRKPAP